MTQRILSITALCVATLSLAACDPHTSVPTEVVTLSTKGTVTGYEPAVFMVERLQPGGPKPILNASCRLDMGRGRVTVSPPVRLSLPVVDGDRPNFRAECTVPADADTGKPVERLITTWSKHWPKDDDIRLYGQYWNDLTSRFYTNDDRFSAKR